MNVMDNVVVWLMGLLNSIEQVEVLCPRAVRKVAFAGRHYRKTARNDGSFASFSEVLTAVRNGRLMQLGLRTMREMAAEAIQLGTAKRWIAANRATHVGTKEFTLLDLQAAATFHKHVMDSAYAEAFALEIDLCHDAAELIELEDIEKAIKAMAGEVVLADSAGVMVKS